MKNQSHSVRSLIGLAILALVSAMAAGQKTTVQAAPASDSNNIVPRLVRFSGSFTDSNGKPLSGILGVTFSLYKDSEGGAPLWMETQNVQPDSKGHYSVLLGSTKSDGVTSDLFASGEARWLGVQVQGQAEQPRVLMVSVPYALKAVDADTLGGKPASAFQLALPQALASTSSVTASAFGKTSSENPPCATDGGAGTAGRVPLWTAPCTLSNSNIYQLGNGYIGVNQSAPNAQLDVQGAINAEPIAAQQSSGTFGILKTPVLGIGWPQNRVILANGNLWVGGFAGGQNFQSGDSGVDNTFLGYRSGAYNTSGSANTFAGFQSGYVNTTGQANSFLGAGSGKANTTGTSDTFVGVRSGFSNIGGGLNAFFGVQSGYSNTTGAQNTFLGTQACYNITTGSSDICIGYNVGPPTSGAGTSNTIWIGAEGVHTAAYVAGIYSEAVGTTNASVCIDNTGKLGTSGCPAAGTGTVTSVGSGLGLTGGPITTSGTLKIDTTVVPLLNTPNTFTANQTVNGTVSATSNTAEAILGVSNVDNAGCPNSGCAGVTGIENGSNNDTVGVYGYTASQVGTGVYGENVSPSSVLGGPPDPSAGIWGDSSAQYGVLGTSDSNIAMFGLNATNNDPSSPTAYFENDSPYDSDVVFEASGFNDPNAGDCIIDTAGDLSCSRTLSAANLSTGSGGANTDLAGSCTISGGSCSQAFTLSYTLAPICVATDTTAVNPVQVVTTIASVTINGTSGDVANYMCIGRDNPPPTKRGEVQRKHALRHAAHRAVSVHK